MLDDTYLRERMVRELVEARGVRDPRVLAAMRGSPSTIRAGIQTIVDPARRAWAIAVRVAAGRRPG